MSEGCLLASRHGLGGRLTWCALPGDGRQASRSSFGPILPNAARAVIPAAAFSEGSAGEGSASEGSASEGSASKCSAKVCARHRAPRGSAIRRDGHDGSRPSSTMSWRLRIVVRKGVTCCVSAWAATSDDAGEHQDDANACRSRLPMCPPSVRTSRSPEDDEGNTGWNAHDASPLSGLDRGARGLAGGDYRSGQDDESRDNDHDALQKFTL